MVEAASPPVRPAGSGGGHPGRGTTSRRLPGMSWMAAALVTAAVTGLVVASGRPDYAHLLLQILLTVAFAVTWNIVGGLGGQHSFAQPIFFGAGAYFGALVLLRWPGCPIVVVMLGAAAVATVFAAILTPCFRARGPYFAILTVAVAEGLRTATNAFGPGRTTGLYLPISASPSDAETVVLAAAVVLLALLAFRLFERSTAGIGLRMIDVDEDAAAAVGVPTVRLKVLAFLAGAPFVGALGALFGASETFIDANTVFDINIAVTAILATLLGGIATFWGPVLGGVVWELLSHQIRIWLHQPGVTLMVYGVILLLVIDFMPRGLFGFGRTLRHGRLAQLRRRAT